MASESCHPQLCFPCAAALGPCSLVGVSHSSGVVVAVLWGISASDLHNTHEREKSKMAVRLGLLPHTRIVLVICGRFISAERLNATGGGRIEGAYRASLKYSVVSSLLPGAPRLRSSCWLNIFRFSVFCAVGGRRNTGKNQGPAGRRRICHLRYGRAGEVLVYSVHTLSSSLFSTPALKKIPMPTHEDLFRGYQDTGNPPNVHARQLGEIMVYCKSARHERRRQTTTTEYDRSFSILHQLRTTAVVVELSRRDRRR